MRSITCGRISRSLPLSLRRGGLTAALAMLAVVSGADAQTELRPAVPWAPGFESPWLQDCIRGDDAKPVEDYDGSLGVTKEYVALHSKSTLQLQWRSKEEIKSRGYPYGTVGGRRWCTGTLIAEDLVLTAGHCLSTRTWGWLTPFRIAADGRAICARPHVLARLMRVNFGYLREGEPSDAFEVVELKEPKARVADDDILCDEVKDGSSGEDYAIIRIGRDAKGHFPNVKYHPIARIRIDDARKNDAIAIIQHPENAQTKESGPMKVAAGRVLGLIGSELLYDNVDTSNTSSGSGIRDKDGMIIGVHTLGGCQKGHAVGGHVVWANAGIRTSAIAKVSETLRTLAKR